MPHPFGREPTTPPHGRAIGSGDGRNPAGGKGRFFKGSNLVIGSKKRVAGLKLNATDADWTHGDGPEVSGPMISLLMAMTGRKAAIDDLKGEGVETLRSR